MSGWFTGGFIHNHLNVIQPIQSTEKIIDGISIEPGPDLPYPLAAHCIVHIGGNLFFIAGGFEHDYKTPSKKAFLMVSTVLKPLSAAASIGFFFLFVQGRLLFKGILF